MKGKHQLEEIMVGSKNNDRLPFQFSKVQLSLFEIENIKSSTTIHKIFELFYYFSDQFLRSHMPQSESVFKGEFIVKEGDFLPQGAVQIGSYVHVQKSRFYQHKLDLVFSGSSLKDQYVHNEVFLLEGTKNQHVKVHFNLHFNPLNGAVNGAAIHEALLQEIQSESSILEQVKIETESVNIQERLSTVAPPTLRDAAPGLVFGESTVRYSSSSEHPNLSDNRQCHPFHIEYCKHLPYNFTTFPNGMGHQHHEEAKMDLERFK